MAYARALLKLSGEALMGDQGYGIDPAIMQSIAEDVSSIVPLALLLEIPSIKRDWFTVEPITKIDLPIF